MVRPLMSVVLGTFFAMGGGGSKEEVSSAARAWPAASMNDAKSRDAIRKCRKVDFFIGFPSRMPETAPFYNNIRSAAMASRIAAVSWTKINPRIMLLDARQVPCVGSCLLSYFDVRFHSGPAFGCGAVLEWCAARRGGKPCGRGHDQAIRVGEQRGVHRLNFRDWPVHIRFGRSGRLYAYSERRGRDFFKLQPRCHSGSAIQFRGHACGHGSWRGGIHERDHEVREQSSARQR